MHQGLLIQHKQLHTTLGKMELALGAISDSIVWTNENGIIQWCNSSFDRLVSHAHIDILGKNLFDMLPLYHNDKRLLKNKYPINNIKINSKHVGVYEHKRSDHTYELEISSNAIQISNNETCIISVIRDISEFQSALKRIEFLASFPTESPYPILRINDKNEITYANRPSDKLLKYLQSKAGKHALSGLFKSVNDALSTKELIKFEMLIGKKTYLLNVSHSTSLDYVNIYGIDITDRKKSEEDLKNAKHDADLFSKKADEANRLKSQFLANMSHELRTPLNAIIGFSELLYEEKLGKVAPEHKEYLGDIVTSSKHLLQLINDILDLSKIESGKIELHPERINLYKLCNEVKDILLTMILRKNIQVNLNIDPALKNIILDSVKFKQVLYNYLSNALKFSHDGGKVELHIYPFDDNYFRVEVTDTGIGISENDISKLFSEFQQLDTKHMGTGLGLALSRRIIESQGGKVGVVSTLGAGSTFYALLPYRIANNKVRKQEVKQRAGIKRHNNTVLIIDDDQKSLKLASQALIKNGYHVIRETNGTNGLSTALKIKPAAIILDLLLPTINGFEFLQKFRRTDAGKHTPIIVWTVKELTSKDRKILNKSAQAVVQKDGKTNLLVSALQTNLPLSLLKMKS